VSVKYSDFRTKILSHVLSKQEIDNFCGFTDYTTLYFIVAAGLLAAFCAGLGVFIFIYWTRLGKVDLNLIQKSEEEGRLEEKFVEGENKKNNILRD
jgi:hypothetical protein